MKKTLLIASCLILFPFANCFGAQQTLYVSSSGSGDCSSPGTPCSLSTALSTVAGGDGDTIILADGTYTGDLTLNDTTDHDNLTITTTAAVISALGTFTRGIPDGSDNRPYFSECSLKIADGVSGVTIQYMRIRGGANPYNQHGGIGVDWSGVVTINEPNNTIAYTEIWNGGNCLGIGGAAKGIVLNHLYIHNGGVIGEGDDNHGIGIYNWSNEAEASSWTDKLYIANTTIATFSGDCFQDVSGQSNGSGNGTHYIEFDNCSLSGADEQAFDTKGSSYVKIHDSDLFDCKYGAIGTNSSYGSHEYFWVYNNKIYSNNGYAIGPQNGSYWYVWNNLIYDNCKNMSTYGYNVAVISFHQRANSYFEHNVVWGNFDQAGGALTCHGIENASSNVIRNNIFYNNGTASGDNGNIYSDTGTINYNYVYPTSPGTTGSNAVTSNNPYFKNIASAPYDFHLDVDNSPCDNAGFNLTGDAVYTIDTDADGEARDSSPWLGAYETEGGSTPTPSTMSGVTVTGGSIQ